MIFQGDTGELRPNNDYLTEFWGKDRPDLRHLKESAHHGPIVGGLRNCPSPGAGTLLRSAIREIPARVGRVEPVAGHPPRGRASFLVPLVWAQEASKGGRREGDLQTFINPEAIDLNTKLEVLQQSLYEVNQKLTNLTFMQRTGDRIRMERVMYPNSDHGLTPGYVFTPSRAEKEKRSGLGGGLMAATTSHSMRSSSASSSARWPRGTF